MNSDLSLVGLEEREARKIAEGWGVPVTVRLLGEKRENCIRRVVKVQKGEEETVLFVSDFLPPPA